MAANTPLTGMVNTQAHNKLVVTPHLTALKRLVAPTPIIAPAAIKRESPGKNGVTTKPVSAKIMMNNIK